MWNQPGSFPEFRAWGRISRTRDRLSGVVIRSGDRMKEVLGLLALALVFFAIAYFIGLPTVWAVGTHHG